MRSGSLQQCGDGVDGQLVAEPAETGDHARRHRRQHRRVAERLAGGRVGEVQLDDGSVEGGHRVVERPRGVAERAGVDDQGVGAAPGGVHGVDQLALVVRLEVLELEAVAAGGRLGPLDVVGQGGGPVDGGLALAEQVQVRPRQEDTATPGSRHGVHPCPPG